MISVERLGGFDREVGYSIKFGIVSIMNYSLLEIREKTLLPSPRIPDLFLKRNNGDIFVIVVMMVIFL